MIMGAAAVLRWSPEMIEKFEKERKEGKTRKAWLPVNWRIARGRVFFAKACAATLQAAAYYMPIYFISSYARRIGMTSSTGAALIGMQNGLSAAGKIILGYVADRFGRINTLIICTFISSVAVLGIWAPASLMDDYEGSREKGLFVSYVVIYGITAGVYVSLFPTVLVELFGVQNFASVNGFLYMLRGVGTLVGTPLSGMLIRGGRLANDDPGGFSRAIFMTGSLLIAAAFGVGWVRWEMARRDGWRWKA